MAPTNTGWRGVLTLWLDRDLADRPGVIRAVIEERAWLIEGHVLPPARLQSTGRPAAVLSRDDRVSHLAIVTIDGIRAP